MEERAEYMLARLKNCLNLMKKLEPAYIPQHRKVIDEYIRYLERNGYNVDSLRGQLDHLFTLCLDVIEISSMSPREAASKALLETIKNIQDELEPKSKEKMELELRITGVRSDITGFEQKIQKNEQWKEVLSAVARDVGLDSLNAEIEALQEQISKSEQLVRQLALSIDKTQEMVRVTEDELCKTRHGESFCKQFQARHMEGLLLKIKDSVDHVVSLFPMGD